MKKEKKAIIFLLSILIIIISLLFIFNFSNNHHLLKNTTSSLFTQYGENIIGEPIYTEPILDSKTDLMDYGKITTKDSYGSVEYKENLIISKETNYTFKEIENNIIISKDYIDVNSETIPELNQPATLHFFDIDYKNPILLRNGIWLQDKKLDCIDQNCSVDVDGFSIYTIVNNTFNGTFDNTTLFGGTNLSGGFDALAWWDFNNLSKCPMMGFNNVSDCSAYNLITGKQEGIYLTSGGHTGGYLNLSSIANTDVEGKTSPFDLNTTTDNSSVLTVFLWVNYSSNASGYAFMSEGGGTSGGWILSQVASTARLRLALRQAGADIYTCTSGTPIPYGDKNWHSLYVSAKLSSINRTQMFCELRIDGTKVNITTVETNTYKPSTNGWRIGSRGGGTNYLTGKIDDIAIFGRNLTEEEVLYLNNSLTEPMKFVGKGNYTTEVYNCSTGCNNNNLTKIYLNGTVNNITVWGRNASTLGEITTSTYTISTQSGNNFTWSPHLTGNYTQIQIRDASGNKSTSMNIPDYVITFDNYTVEEGEEGTTNPLITGVLPILNNNYNVSDRIMIAGNVTDDTAVSRVFANISEPNGTFQII